MFLIGLIGVAASSVAGTITAGPHMEWWATSARHPVAPGISLQFSQAQDWWSIDAGVAWSIGLERSATLTVNHHFVRTHVLWSPHLGVPERQVYLGMGPSLTVHQGSLVSSQTRSFTSVSPGARAQMGLRGTTSSGVAWGWFVGSTTVDWPRAHYDTGFTLGVGW